MPDIPFVTDFDPAYGEAVAVSPLIRRVVARNPGPFTYTGTGVYIVGRPDGGDLAVIDPGPDDPDHLAALGSTVGGARVACVLVTHTHRDHCAGARRFADAAQAPVLAAGPHPTGGDKAPGLEEGADLAFRPDREIRDGEVVDGDGWTIETVATPGHLSNHLCFALREENALFTGDHIMGWSTTVVAPPEGSMGDYLKSLDRLLARSDTIYYPTHGAPIERPHRYVRATRAHRLMRDAQILDQLKKGRNDIRDLVSVMYADIDPRLHKAAALNVFAHLIRLVETGTVTTEGTPSLGSRYRLAG